MITKPCPVCSAPYGFHDDAPHEEAVRRIPAHLLLPTHAVEKAARAEVREQARQEWMRRQGRTQMPLQAILARWQVGSGEWTWDQEFDDLWQRDGAALDLLAASVQEAGFREPILLGNDGRIWDGHHRLAVAQRLGIEHVPVEFAQQVTA